MNIIGKKARHIKRNTSDRSHNRHPESALRFLTGKKVRKFSTTNDDASNAKPTPTEYGNIVRGIVDIGKDSAGECQYCITCASQTSKTDQVPSNRSFIKNLFTICYTSLFKATLLRGGPGWLIDKVPRNRGEQQSRQACCYECHSPVVVQCNCAPRKV